MFTIFVFCFFSHSSMMASTDDVSGVIVFFPIYSTGKVSVFDEPTNTMMMAIENIPSYFSQLC